MVFQGQDDVITSAAVLHLRYQRQRVDISSHWSVYQLSRLVGL